ncbi:MAG: hypothetical protein OXF44_06940 [Anaerolineaceae bacterium]|nr:hypothetical protein [Anaerolineaceae bacterium]
MKSLTGRHVLVLYLLPALLLASHLLAQGTDKTPLPTPLSPVITLNSNIDDNGDETGNFTIVSPNTTQFANAESVDWLAVNASTRGEAEGSLTPSDAGTITVEAEDLEYEDGHIISFSLVQIAALDDATYTNSARLIFCYPVHESCDDPETIIRSLPPPLNATISLVTPEPTATPDPNAQGLSAESQTSDDSGTFQVSVPLVGNVITNAQGFGWSADNSDGNSASGQENLGGEGAQAQAEETVETIQFGSNLVQYDVGDILRIILRSLAQEDSSRYVDSHPVVYYFCEDPNDANPDCASLWSSATSGNNGGNNNNGNGNGAGSGGAGGSGSFGNCLNTDNAAPIKVCANSDYTQYTLYGVFQDSSTTDLATVSSSSALHESQAAASTLASGTNSAANKSYTLTYDGEGVMTLSTYYADKGPDVDKPYIITIDTHNTVRYVQW